MIEVKFPVLFVLGLRLEAVTQPKLPERVHCDTVYIVDEGFEACANLRQLSKWCIRLYTNAPDVDGKAYRFLLAGGWAPLEL